MSLVAGCHVTAWLCSCLHAADIEVVSRKGPVPYTAMVEGAGRTMISAKVATLESVLAGVPVPQKTMERVISGEHVVDWYRSSHLLFKSDLLHYSKHCRPGEEGVEPLSRMLSPSLPAQV